MAMTSQTQTLLDYRYGTKREGWTTLFWGGFTSIGLIAWIHVFRHFVDMPSLTLVVIWDLFAAALGALLIFGYAIPNIKMNGEFRFLVTSEEISCISPAAKFGDSYTIPICEITALEKKSGSEGSYNFFLQTSDNRRLNITQNYKNPRRKILKIVRELRPGLPEKHT
jgi:hypothetical protein